MKCKNILYIPSCWSVVEKGELTQDRLKKHEFYLVELDIFHTSLEESSSARKSYKTFDIIFLVLFTKPIKI